MTEPHDAPPPPPPPPSPPPWSRSLRSARRLTRSRDDRVIAGVAGGIAETYGLDVALVRLLFAAAAIVTAGAAGAAYLIAWAAVPEDPGGEPLARTWRRDRRSRSDARLWVGLIVVGIGVLALADEVDGPFGSFGNIVGPLVLIGAGVAVLAARPRVSAPSPRPASQRADTPSGADPQMAPPNWAESESEPDTASQPVSAYSSRVAWPTPPPVSVPPRVRGPRDHTLGRLTWSALFLLVGSAWLIDATSAADVNIEVVLAIALALIGVALVIGAWFGRARGLIGLALVVTFAAVVATTVDVPLRGGIGEATQRPLTAADVKSTYRHGIGELRIDLRAIDFDGATKRIEITNGIGEIRVVLADDAAVEFHGHADVGEVQWPATEPASGIDAALDERAAASDGTGLLIIDAKVGLGAIHVERESADRVVR